MTHAEDKGIGIKGWLSGSKPKKQTTQELSGTLLLDNHRIAVLPFGNISPDPRDEYFADGMTEEMISTISHIGDFSVISRTSTMKFKGGGDGDGDRTRAERGNTSGRER